VFNGRITAIEAQYPQQQPPEATLLAEDRFQDLRMERRTRTFEDVTDADVVHQIAAQHGLTAEVDADGPTYRVLTQLNQSDLAFLRERAIAIDADVWTEERTLHFQARQRRNGGTVPLRYGGNLLEFSILADLAHQRTAVRVSGWDVGNKSQIDVEAAESVIRGELNGQRSGSAVLDGALAQRYERIVTAVPLSEAEARAMAEARYRERARRFLTGMGLTDGTPAIRVGTIVELSELGRPFDGKYTVTVTRHTFDRTHGYRTAFEVERPGIGE
jgi:phage protein D